MLDKTAAPTSPSPTMTRPASAVPRHLRRYLCLDDFEPTARRIADFIGESAVLGFQFVLLYYGWVLTERMGDETTISLPWIKVAWVNSVLPITGGFMLLISVARLVGIVSHQSNTQEGHGTWSGSSSE